MFADWMTADWTMYESTADVIIGLAYFAIPVQFIRLIYHPLKAFDYSKLNSKMTSGELGMTRHLMQLHTLYIALCGTGHMLTAMRVSCDGMNYAMVVIKTTTCVVSVLTAVTMAKWVPRLQTWMDEVEVHRRGFMAKESEEGSICWEAKELELSDIREQVVRLEAERNALLHKELLSKKMEVSRQQADPTRDSLQESLHDLRLKEFSTEMMHFPEKLAKSADAGLINMLQLLFIAAALRRLQAQQSLWSEQPDATWGVFLQQLETILKSRNLIASADRRAKIDLLGITENWHAVLLWTSRLDAQRLQNAIEAAVAFRKHSDPLHVKLLADRIRALVPLAHSESPSCPDQAIRDGSSHFVEELLEPAPEIKPSEMEVHISFVELLERILLHDLVKAWQRFQTSLQYW